MLRLLSLLRIIAKYGLIYHHSVKSKFLKLIFFLISPFSFIKTQRFGEKLVAALAEMGPIYIKFGQLLSTRADIVGLEIAQDLANLQDSLPQSKFSEVEKILIAELGSNWNDNFIEFNRKSISSASIAEVYKAKLVTGEDVAVKILKPGIREKYERDIALFKFCAKLIDKFSAKSRRFNLQEIVKVLESGMKLEINLQFEAAACAEIAEANHESDIIIPKIYWHLVSTQILVLEWIDGVPVKEIHKLPNIDKKLIAQKIALCFFNQSFKNGFFHADLHPGNILVTREGRVAFLDFGISCRLSEQDRFAVASILHGFLSRKYSDIAELHMEVGYVPKNTDLGLFSLACRSIGEKIVGLPVNQISIGKLLGDLFYINDFFQMELQPQLLLLQKNLVMVEGVGTMLHEDINMWNLIEPCIKSWAVHNITPEAKMMKFVKKTIKNFLR
jgi:ubiquinone biosynthesis protein